MDDPSRNPVPPQSEDHVHERSDVAIRPLAMFLASLVMGLAVVAVSMIWLFSFFLATTNTDVEDVPVIVAPVEPFAAPRLQVTEQLDLDTLRARETKILESTEWLDREAGIVRIPLAHAIELVAERGFPAWPKTEVNPPVAQEPTAQPGDATDSLPADSADEEAQ